MARSGRFTLSIFDLFSIFVWKKSCYIIKSFSSLCDVVETPCFKLFCFVLDLWRQVFRSKKKNISFLNFQRSFGHFGFISDLDKPYTGARKPRDWLFVPSCIASSCGRETHGELWQLSHVGWEEESVPGQQGGDGEARSQQLNRSYRISRLSCAQSVCQFSKCRMILIADANQC